jgi:hypothetical protein
MNTTEEQARSGRLIAFRIVALLGGLLFTLPSLIYAYLSIAEVDGQEIHVVHNLSALAVLGSIGGVSLLLLAWRPRQTALVRLAVASAIGGLVGAILAGVPFSYLLIGPIFAVILVALSPDRSAVFRFDSPNLFLLALAFIGAIPGVVEALQQADLQGGRMSGDEHLEMLHYATMSTSYLTLILAAAWSAFPARAVRTARLLTGSSGALLAVTFLAYPDAVSSVDTVWAVALLVLSIVYLAAGEVASRSGSSSEPS